MGDIGEILAPHLSKIQKPNKNDNVYKDECCLSFDTPYSEGGLYVCLNTFLSFGRKYVQFYHNITGNSVFLHLKKIPSKSETEESTENIEKPTRLAIGMEGGFNSTAEEEKFEEKNLLVILPKFTEISIDKITEFPDVLQQSINGVFEAESASKKEEVSPWDGEILAVSKHSETLEQLDNGVKIAPSGWKCSLCDLTENLWANLTDGTILCGRRYYDGSGGNEHALEYFRRTGYPLVVKLGTITPDGADVFSYDEDDMVQDPKLAEHLAHFGINMMNMKKSDKTMTELQIDKNQNIGNEWEILQESGKKLKPRYGSHFTGMKNMGNTCYLNSTMQVLSSFPEISDAYCTKYKDIFTRTIKDPGSDFNAQMTKLLLGLASGDYSKLHDEENDVDKSNGITPGTFKRLVGQDHKEFLSNNQQDAEEYLLHVLNLIERNSRVLGNNPASCLKFTIEERIECVKSKKVRYANRPEFVMSLPVPIYAALNKEDVEKYESKIKAAKLDKSVTVGDQVRARIPFSACLEIFMEDAYVDNFWSSELKEKTTAKKRTRFVTFPKYLVVQLEKFTVGDDWVPKKLDVSIDMPETLDLESYRGKGILPSETPLPDEEQPKINEPEINEEMVSQLVGMGFPYHACRKAVHFTHNQNVEVAMDWLMKHISDPDFAEPLQMTQQRSQPDGAAAPAVPLSDESISMIASMGFTKDQAIKALKSTGNNLERAVDWIFSHPDELDTVAVGEGDNPNAQQATVPMEVAQSEESETCDGPGKYELTAFISHMGTSSMCGHYVCHIKKDGRWIIFNDRKVAESEEPPMSLGYLYFYKRKED